MIADNEIQAIAGLLSALFLLMTNAYYLLRGLAKSAFSALYWLSIAAVLSVPLCFDLVFGLPQQALMGRVGYLLPFADRGINAAAVFAFGHVTITALVYFIIIKRHNLANKDRPGTASQQFSWLVRSPHAIVLFGIVFVFSSAIAIYRRFDLTRAFNDFLDPSTPPSYEIYFFFASTPIMAILWAKGRQYRKHAIGVGAVSVIVSYFLGIRYYMFPFIGYLVWMMIIDAKKSLKDKVGSVMVAAAIAWIGFTLWGVIRSLDLRSDPLAILQDPMLFTSSYGYSLNEHLIQGNELATRIGYYDLVARLQMLDLFRGFESLIATISSAIYPFIMRFLGVPLPVSNAKLIYELQTGIIGSGVSSGTTAFGSDWFAWGWWGIPIGGIAMGALLALGDIAYKCRHKWWILIGPMWTFQLIFFARGGTDVWLGIWGRFLPLSLIILFFIRILDNWRARVPRKYSWRNSQMKTSAFRMNYSSHSDSDRSKSS